MEMMIRLAVIARFNPAPVTGRDGALTTLGPHDASAVTPSPFVNEPVTIPVGGLILAREPLP